MQMFVGTKIVKATPMTRKAYNDLRKWELPKDENGSDEGYLVEYPESAPNFKGYDGYVSWSPKAEFEKVYLAFTTELEEPHQVRMVAELTQLRTNIDKLGAFVSSTKFKELSPVESSAMLQQMDYMTMYSNVLEKRIALQSIES